MADRGDTHYHVPTLNRWFTLSSIALLVSSFWMVYKDFQRPWKVYQREFRAMEIDRGRAELATPEAVAAVEERDRIDASRAQLETELNARGSALKAARDELVLLRDAEAKADAAARVAKQEASWERYLVDEWRLHHPGEEDLAAYQEKRAELEEMEEEMFASANELKAAQAAKEAKEAEIEELQSGLAELEGRMRDATKDYELTIRKLEQIDPEDPATKLANLVRDDIPGLDFIGPTIKVIKSMPPELTFELNFTKKPRIDMCQTCHVPVDKEGWEDVENPFQTHPRLDLFLTAKSPHPLNQMGCTICHRGAGEALDFGRADHRANDEEQGEEWADEYHWHKLHYWDYPMLPLKYVEAGCVQCHKDSMEVIAPEAPKVAEGYELFERYGCYACHKVEWFPTKRRPGPTLAKILQKTDSDFIASWVTNPKSFRPTTWMPQIFHLENYSPDTKIVESNYGTGREMMGDEWSDAAIASVVAFIESRSVTAELPPVPVEGDAARGAEVFRLAGCLACHNIAPWDEADHAESTDPAEKRRGTNEHGPNLRGIATKTTPEWLFHWIKEPATYWGETRMPDLRLPDQDIADIVAYVFEDPDGIFSDVPEGWTEGPRPYERDVLEEQARWFLNRSRPDELEASFAGEWADDQDLLIAMGERWVLNQGCHSCHEIPGLETANPIGTELTTWASKTVDKLDFGFVPELKAHARGHEVGSNEFHHFVYEYKQYRENFLEQKLDAPRSFDREKVKNPSERLRMPWFDFTEEEIEAITCFVAGLVENEVEHARMIPSPERLAMDTGLRVIRQKNCAACHVIEPGTIDFTDPDGVHRSIKGQLLALDEEFLDLPADMTRRLKNFADIQEYFAYYREEFDLDEVYAVLLGTDVDFGVVGDNVAIEDVDSVRVNPAWGGDFVDVVAKYYVDPTVYDPENDEYLPITPDPDGEGKIQDVDGEWRDFSEEPYDKLRWTYAPPVLIGEGEKLQRDWFYRFLLDPVELRPQIRVKMPTFTWAEGEAAAVVDYFAIKAREEWPKEYARQMLRRTEMTTDEIAEGIAGLGLSGSSGDQVQGIADGLPVETAAGLPNLLAFGESRDFEFYPPVDPTYEAIPHRTPEWLDAYFAERPDFYDDVHRLVVDPAGPTCVQCHPLAGSDPTNETPIGWAPDLSHTRERLRPDWLRRWLTQPARVYPGTTMPANFDPDLPPQWQELYEAPPLEQIEAVMTWLFNLDRALIKN